MLIILFFTWLWMLPFGNSIINCRIACRRCREKMEFPEILEVYCAMCDECKERRREWLEGAPSLLRVDNNEEYLTNYGHQDSQDECTTTPIDDCDSPHIQLLTNAITTTTSTTTSTTTTTTTTRRPCHPRPYDKPTPPCQSIPCPIPMAIPVYPMCQIQMPGSFYTVTVLQSSVNPETIAPKKLTGTTSSGLRTSTTSELYFYLGVPKKLLQQLQTS